MADDCAPRSIQEELEIARRALRERDLRHAAFHVSGALAHDPNHLEALAILEALFEAADDPLTLAPFEEEGNTWYGTVAMRAWLLLRLKRVGEALVWLARVAEAVPQVPYFTWLSSAPLDGVTNEEVATAATVLMRMALRLPAGGMAPEDPARITARLALDLLGRIRETRRALPEPLHASVILLRRLGRFEEARHQAHALEALRPDYASAATLAATLREAGDLEGAIAASRTAAERAPEAAAPLLDVGDNMIELGRFDEAIRAYEEALRREPGEPWAQSHLLYARYRATQDESARASLRELVIARPDDRRARWLLAQIGKPLFDKLPGPCDATANALRAALDTVRSGDGPWKLKMTLSHPEGPSNLLALRLVARAHGREPDVTWSFTHLPHPDPRLPLPGTEPLLYRLEHDALVPALPPADPAVQREVAAIAQTPYLLAEWSERAQVLGLALGPARAEQLLRVMLDPPPLPDKDLDAPDWVQGIQIAAALALAQIDAGWSGSERRRFLLAVAGGPIDWTVTAAVVALTWVATRTPTAVPDVLATFAALRDREPDAGGCTYAIPLRQAWLELPGVSGAQRARLERELNELLEA